jgi:hypothetical protein
MAASMKALRSAAGRLVNSSALATRLSSECARSSSWAACSGDTRRRAPSSAPTKGRAAHTISQVAPSSALSTRVFTLATTMAAAASPTMAKSVPASMARRVRTRRRTAATAWARGVGRVVIQGGPCREKKVPTT